jgi:5'-3' exonuclease
MGIELVGQVLKELAGDRTEAQLEEDKTFPLRRNVPRARAFVECARIVRGKTGPVASMEHPLRLICDGNNILYRYLCVELAKHSSISYASLQKIAENIRNAYVTSISRAVIVFDGIPPEEKNLTLAKRAATAAAGPRGEDFEHIRDAGEEGISTRNISVRVTSKTVALFVELFRELGLPTIIAKGEADHLIAALTNNGVAEVPVTEDYDMLSYPSSTKNLPILRQPTVAGAGKFDILNRNKFWAAIGVTTTEMVYRASSIMGNDYCPKLPRLGVKTVVKFFFDKTPAVVDGHAQRVGVDYFEAYSKSINILSKHPLLELVGESLEAFAQLWAGSACPSSSKAEDEAIEPARPVEPAEEGKEGNEEIEDEDDNENFADEEIEEEDSSEQSSLSSLSDETSEFDSEESDVSDDPEEEDESMRATCTS